MHGTGPSRSKSYTLFISEKRQTTLENESPNYFESTPSESTIIEITRNDQQQPQNNKNNAKNNNNNQTNNEKPSAIKYARSTINETTSGAIGEDEFENAAGNTVNELQHIEERLNLINENISNVNTNIGRIKVGSSISSFLPGHDTSRIKFDLNRHDDSNKKKEESETSSLTEQQTSGGTTGGSGVDGDANAGGSGGGGDGEGGSNPNAPGGSIAADGDTNASTTGAAAEHIVRKFRQKFIILHYSPFKAVWDWIILLLVVYTAVFTPFTVAFLLNEDEKRAKLNQHASTRLFKKQQSGADPFVIIDLIVDLMFLLDIFISFRTTFVSKEGEAIYDPMIIAKHYLRGWFIIDAFSAMPYDLLLFGSGNIDTIKITGLLKTFRLIRLIRILPKLQKFSEYGMAMLLLLLAVFALVGHWLACVFYAIAYIERPTLPEPKYSWLDHLAEKYNMPFLENNSESGPDLKSKYITALFFTLTSLTSVGFGNVSPNTNYEKMFSICSMLLGSAIFGNVTTIMMKMYQGTEELKEMQESMKDFIKFHTIPKMLARRMQESFEHTWSYTNGIDMNTVLKTFPESLQADICLHLNRQLLNTCAAFQDASDGCLRMLALQFKSTHVPPGDTLIHKGDNLTAIYFIARGTIEITRDDEVLAILDKNDIFGENIGKYQERDVMGRSSCDVRALSYCDLHKIERSDLLDVMETYPDFADSFEEKFQVTFDLRECELTEQKPVKKKLSKTSKSSTKRPSKTSSSRSLQHSQHSLLHQQQQQQQKPQINIENVDEDDKIEQSFLRSSLPSVKRLLSSGTDSVAVTSTSDDGVGALDTSLNITTIQFSQQQPGSDDAYHKQRSVTSYSSAATASSGGSSSTMKRVSSGGILRKKSRIVRNMTRLTATPSPVMTSAATAATAATSSDTSAADKPSISPTTSNVSRVRRDSKAFSQLSSLVPPPNAEAVQKRFEAEIDQLFARVTKVEETLKNQIDELTCFIYKVVASDIPKPDDTSLNIKSSIN